MCLDKHIVIIIITLLQPPKICYTNNKLFIGIISIKFNVLEYFKYLQLNKSVIGFNKTFCDSNKKIVTVFIT